MQKNMHQKWKSLRKQRSVRKTLKIEFFFTFLSRRIKKSFFVFFFYSRVFWWQMWVSMSGETVWKWWESKNLRASRLPNKKDFLQGRCWSSEELRKNETASVKSTSAKQENESCSCKYANNNNNKMKVNPKRKLVNCLLSKIYFINIFSLDPTCT